MGTDNGLDRKLVSLIANYAEELTKKLESLTEELEGYKDLSISLQATINDRDIKQRESSIKRKERASAHLNNLFQQVNLSDEESIMWHKSFDDVLR